MRNTCLLSILIITAIVSCESVSDVKKQFGPSRQIYADSVIINQMLQINNMVKLEDYVILQNGSDGVEDFYFVYSYPEFNFLYSFAKRGRGDSECLMPSVIKNTPGNLFGLRDHSNDKVMYYNITDSLAEPIFSCVFPSPDNNRFFWEINQMEDSLFLIKHQGYKRGETELWSMKSGVKDKIRNTFFRLQKQLGKEYYTIFDDYIISAEGSRFAISYFMIDRIEFGKIEDGKIFKTSWTGASATPNFYLYGQDTDTEFSIDRNIIYYENLYSGHDFVYALYSGQRLDETEKNHSSMIEIYSWDGSPIELLQLDIPLAHLAVDEKNQTIIGVNSEVSDEKIFIYNYGNN